MPDARSVNVAAVWADIHRLIDGKPDLVFLFKLMFAFVPDIAAIVLSIAMHNASQRSLRAQNYRVTREQLIDERAALTNLGPTLQEVGNMQIELAQVLKAHTLREQLEHDLLAGLSHQHGTQPRPKPNGADNLH